MDKDMQRLANITKHLMQNRHKIENAEILITNNENLDQMERNLLPDYWPNIQKSPEPPLG